MSVVESEGVPGVNPADVAKINQRIKEYTVDQPSGPVSIIDAMDNLVPGRREGRDVDRPKIESERLKQILPEVLAEKKDLFETLIWDLEYNREEVGTMLVRLKKVRPPRNPEPGYVHPYEATLTVLHALGAIEDDGITLRDAQSAKAQFGGDYAEQQQQWERESAENVFKNAFRKEMLRPEQVYETIRFENRSFIDDNGKEQSALHMVVEFSISSWSKVPQGKQAGGDNRYLAKCVETYLQSRYQWETNVFKDKKMQLIRCLPEGVTNTKLVNILSTLGINSIDLDGESISREDIKSFVAENGKIMGITEEEITSLFGLNTLLSRKKLGVKGRHGWSGDSNVEKTYVTQAMYEGRKYIEHLREQARIDGVEFDEDIEVIGMTSDNMGIIRMVKEKFMRFKNKVKSAYSTVSEDNGMYGIRNNGEAGKSMFGDEGYARDAFWEDNMVYGLLGETDGKMNKIIAEGWSYGGAATLKYAARIASYVEKAWKEKILNGDSELNASVKLKETLRREVEKAQEAITQGVTNLSLISHFGEYQRAVEELRASIDSKRNELIERVKNGLPHFEENSEVGHPDIVYLLNAPCLHKCAIFIMDTPGQGRLASFLSRRSGEIVDLGILLNRVGISKIAAGKATLQTVARLFTAIILPGNGHSDPVDYETLSLPLAEKKKIKKDTSTDQLIAEAGEVHYKNYASEDNIVAVRTQTNDLKNNQRLTRDEMRLLGTHQGRFITVAGLRDRLVGFTDLTRELSYINSDNPCIVVDSGHFTAADDTIRYKARHLSRILFGSTRQQTDVLLSGMSNLASLGIGYEKVVNSPSLSYYFDGTQQPEQVTTSRVKSFRELGYYDYLNTRFNGFFSSSLSKMNKEQKAVREFFYRQVTRAYETNPYLLDLVSELVPSIEPHLVLPTRRDLSEDEINLN